MSSPEVCGPARRLTRIRLHRTIYFCLHRGSLPETTAEGQPRFGGTIPCPKNAVRWIACLDELPSFGSAVIFSIILSDEA
jgi:hypothetical protein